jgi:DNA polymerase III delta prime subunit
VTLIYNILTHHFNNACHLIAVNITNWFMTKIRSKVLKKHIIKFNSWIIQDNVSILNFGNLEMLKINALSAMNNNFWIILKIVFKNQVRNSKIYKISNTWKIHAKAQNIKLIKMDNVNNVHNIPHLLNIMTLAHILNAPTKVSLLKMLSVKIVKIIFILICNKPNAFKIHVLIIKLI